VPVVDWSEAMQTDPLFVNELRVTFKAGATPSALIRCIVERHPGEPEIDRLVRAYFREAFLVPMLQVGREQVALIVQGTGLPALNSSVIHRMVATRNEWDKPAVGDEPPQMCWLDYVTAIDDAEMLRRTEAETRPESVPWWDQLDDDGKRFITRTVANARSLSERIQILTALAEQLQQQLLAANGVESQR
jgi:hypothetical protein